VLSPLPAADFSPLRQPQRATSLIGPDFSSSFYLPTGSGLYWIFIHRQRESLYTGARFLSPFFLLPRHPSMIFSNSDSVFFFFCKNFGPFSEASLFPVALIFRYRYELWEPSPPSSLPPHYLWDLQCPALIVSLLKGLRACKQTSLCFTAPPSLFFIVFASFFPRPRLADFFSARDTFLALVSSFWPLSPAPSHLGLFFFYYAVADSQTLAFPLLSCSSPTVLNTHPSFVPK